MNKSNVDQNKVHFGFKIIIIIMKSEREVNIKKKTSSKTTGVVSRSYEPPQLLPLQRRG